MNPSSEWSGLVSKAVVTVLVTAVAVYAAWWLLRQVVAPLLIVLMLVGLYRLVLGGVRR